MTLLHHHPLHRGRQLRWVGPLVALLFLASLLTLVVQYRVSDQAVATEFFRAHKTIRHTGELLRTGFAAGIALMALLALGITVWALRVTHRIVRPVHALHIALDALAGGELGVRLDLHRRDEFQEVGQALNRLAEKLAEALAAVHTLVDRIAAMVPDTPLQPSPAADLRGLVTELDRTLDFFRLGPRRVIGGDRR